MRESLQTLFGVGTLTSLTDGQLLEQFARGRGEVAETTFTALLERHGPMVLGVCRAVLGDWHDAEDACQATFLVLAQRAGSIRRGGAVGSWLYSTARRVALRARRQSARRRERERRLAQPGMAEPISAPPADPWPELYEELDRLPEPFRAVVVLCDLEGHSYEQAAGTLHCPVGTVQSRLARGRQRLRRRLERRGVSSAVALVATGLTVRSGTAAVSPRLATTIARIAISVAEGQAIAGMVPKTVALLVRAELGGHLMTRVLTVLTTLVMAGLVAAAAIGLVIAGRDDEPKPRALNATRKADASPIHVRVIDIQGKGAPGVLVEVVGLDLPWHSFRTDAGGRVQIPREGAGDQFLLLARHGRESLAWAQVGDPSPNRPTGTKADSIVMKLLPLTHQIEGSVVDREGKPIPGVEIEEENLNHPTNGAVILSLSIQGTRPGTLLAGAVTDQAGRFVLRLPQETSVFLRGLHPRYMGQMSAKAGAQNLEPMILEPAGGIAGTATDAATGRPVAGVIVGAQLLEYRVRILGRWGESMTDDQGRFAITGLEPGVYNLLFERVPGRAKATAPAVEGLRVRAGADTPATLTVIDGRPLRGVVIDQETNRPVAGVQVGCYGPARPNSGAAVLTGKTDQQGRFTFYVPAGEQSVYIMDGVSFSRLSSRTLVVPDQGEIEPVRLLRTSQAIGSARYTMKAQVREKVKEEIRPSPPAPAKVQEKAKPPASDPNVRTLTGRVRDPQGRPLFGVHVNVDPGLPLAGADPVGPDIAITDREGTFVLQGLPRRALQINLNRPNSEFQTEALPADRNEVEWTYRPKSHPQAKRQAPPTEDESIPPGLRQRLTFVDLAHSGNDFLADGPGSGGNDLNRLPRGVHKLGDAFFRVGEMMVHVQGKLRPELPRAVKGIKVRARGRVLHILHATQYGADAGTLIGAYIIHYADGSTERIPIIYGRTLVNWFDFPARKEEPAEAQVAWTGSNDSIDLNPGFKVRLLAKSWTNPHPEKEIATLDVLSAGTACDPFLVAVTLERDR
ncbi:MAG: sigma-70 family RNA polymerase sigma factor [Isosphaerales bacterium]